MNTTTLSPVRAKTIASAVSDVATAEFSATEVETRVGHLAASGFGVGGTLGAIIGAIAVGVASMSTEVVFPGSSVHVAGPLSAMLLGAGAGAANGGLAGALIGWGIPVEMSVAPIKAKASSIRQSLRTAICPHSK